MNKRAESYKKYLEEKNITCFTIEEIENDELNTVAFRSTIEAEGQQLPVVILLDSSVYAMIRVRIAAKSWDDERSAALMQAVNELNRQYKLFKYYFTKAGDIYLDTCLVEKENEVDGERIYLVLSVLIDHLQSVYKELMKEIWQ